MTTIRAARVEDVESIRALIDRFAAEDRMLSRSRDFLLEHLRDFVVAETDGAFAGCCALALLTPDLAEVPRCGLPDAVGSGIGSRSSTHAWPRRSASGLRASSAHPRAEFFERAVHSHEPAAPGEVGVVPGGPKRSGATITRVCTWTLVDLKRSAGEPWGYTRIFLGHEPDREST